MKQGAVQTPGDIAIIGMACRFPGAASIDAFWHNLVYGVESITFFSDHELLAAGVAPAHVSDPSYVKARPILDNVLGFDADFFGYSPREAETIDPQQRLFLQCPWEVLETAGYRPETAGGVTIRMPQKAGYFYRQGLPLSPDGHCRAFDADSKGTLFGSGVGIVLLKRLADAIADQDIIHAVIKGSAINNDGSVKAGFTAPNINGQVAVIERALANAQIDPRSMSYVEAHGTGTELGDPIEVGALNRVFAQKITIPRRCALGSVKTNLGHLAAAAGIAGLITTTLALDHQEIPASLHFKEPNPRIDLVKSPFYVNAELAQWLTEEDTPLRAGVNSFGFGGTNAHVILEQAPGFV